MVIIESNGQFFFQNDVFKLQEDFSELWDQSIPRGWTWKFPVNSYFRDMRQTRGVRKIQKTVLKTRFKTKETTLTFVFEKYLVVSFWSLSIMAFSVFLEDSLRIRSQILSNNSIPLKKINKLFRVIQGLKSYRL
jgi:hypothetical protein